MSSQRSQRRATRAYSHDEEWRKNKNGSDFRDPGIAGLTDDRPSTGKSRKKPSSANPYTQPEGPERDRILKNRGR